MTIDIYNSKSFNLYTDRNGKFWLWDKLSETNAAYRKDTELSAYRSSVELLIGSNARLLEERNQLQRKLDSIETCFETIFEVNKDEY